MSALRITCTFVLNRLTNHNLKALENIVLQTIETAKVPEEDAKKTTVHNNKKK
jgi:hypothetical protein